MQEINNSNLQINSQVMKTTFNPSLLTNNKAKGAVYAEKGEPTYQKDMDADEDGVITLEEFQNYCDENDISYAQRKQMLENRLHYQLNTERAKSSAEIREIKSDANAVYAEEGDENYEKEMDEDKDGKITYEEYMKYCEENAEDLESKDISNAQMESNEDEVVIKNPAKAVSTYAKSENAESESKIEHDA